MRWLFAGATRIGLAGFGCVLLLVLVNTLDLFDPNWPFGLFASFSDTLLLVVPLALIAAWFAWRRALLPLGVLALAALHPVILFDDYAAPTGRTCADPGACLTVVSANVQRREGAVRALADIVPDADVIILLELPRALDRAALLDLFPAVTDAQVFRVTSRGRRIGNSMAVLHRGGATDLAYNEVGVVSRNTTYGGFVSLSHAGPESDRGAPIRILGVHPVMPARLSAMPLRDRTFRRLANDMEDRDSFVVAGDFNMTPWEPAFRDLPGVRAGDPRWARTWNARSLIRRIAIDHALIGDALEVVAFDVLPDVGADHHPIRVVVRRKP